MRPSGSTFAALAAGVVLAAASGARADVPARVRLLVPSCAGELRWAALARALDVELRTLGSALAVDGEADAQLSLDIPCEGDATEALVTLTHVPSGRTHREVIPMGEQGPEELALALAEVVRLRADALAEEPPPHPPPVVDVGELEAQIETAVAEAIPEPEPEPEPPPPAPLGALLDVAFGASSYVAAANTSAELRVGYSFGAPPFRLSAELVASVGWAGERGSDVVFGGPGLGLGVRGGHRGRGWAVASGIRADVGWVHASGFTNDPTLDATEADALHLAVVADARLRWRLGADAWFLVTPEVGAALVGIEILSRGTRRITAQLGPRVGLGLGLSFAP